MDDNLREEEAWFQGKPRPVGGCQAWIELKGFGVSRGEVLEGAVLFCGGTRPQPIGRVLVGALQPDRRAGSGRSAVPVSMAALTNQEVAQPA